MIRVVISLLSASANDFTSELFWEHRCHASFGIDHGYTRGSSWFGMTCQEISVYLRTSVMISKFGMS